MRTKFLCISVLRVASGPRVKLVSCKSALTPTPSVVYSTDRSKAVVPVLVLLFGALWFVLQGDLLYVLPCAILFFCVFQSFKHCDYLACAFRMFDRFVLVWICRFPFLLMSGKGCGFVIVALPGLFSYLSALGYKLTMFTLVLFIYIMCYHV